MHRADLLGLEVEYDASDPEGYRCAAARLRGQLEAQELSLNVFEIPPGESLCPYHYEYVEEWLLVLRGEVVVRAPDGEAGLAAGHIARFAAGPQGAHKVSNRGTENARIIMFSSCREPAVAVYPDSDKIGVWPGRDEDRVMLRRRDGQVPYYDGEV